jgi:predicted RNase H-like HicB family nuclease
MKLTYTIIILPDSEGGYVVEVPALPGCVTYGHTLSEALLMVEDAIEGYLSVLQEDGGPVPKEGKFVNVELGRKREAILRKVTINMPTKVINIV